MALDKLDIRSFQHLNVTSTRFLSVSVSKVCPECGIQGEMRLVDFKYEGQSPLDQIPRYPSSMRGVELLLCEGCRRVSLEKILDHRLHHQTLTLDKLSDHAAKDGCQWSALLQHTIGDPQLLKREKPEMMKGKFSEVYCWLCSPNQRIKPGERIAYVRRLWTSFHEECWTRLKDPTETRQLTL